MKIPVPNTTEYFWVANHQKKSVYDGISRGSEQCWNINKGVQYPPCDAGKGLFIYHEGCEGAPKNFELESSNGKFDWVFNNRWVNNFRPGPPQLIPIIDHEAGNPVSGQIEYVNGNLIQINGINWSQWVTDNPCVSDEDPTGYLVTLDYQGDGHDSYNVNYDEIFSPYSNPASNSKINPQQNSGITIRLVSQVPLGDIRVKIYFDDEQALTECPPSKPKNLKIIKEIINPANGKFHPRLTWDLNTEPDFNNVTNPGHYNIYRSYSVSCDPYIEPNYTYIASVNAPVHEYIDVATILYPYGQGLTTCEFYFLSVSYKIEAVDNTDLVSVKSNRGTINGYITPCSDPDNMLTNQENKNKLPVRFSIFNYPNPFNPVTKINYGLPRNTYVTIKIYNALGELVKTLVNNEYKPEGEYSVMFDGTNFASGIYFYSLETKDYKETKKMVLIK